MRDPSSIPALLKKADRLFSLVVRWEAATDGYVKCVTCRRPFPIVGMQVGHFIPRGVLRLRFDRRNVFPQCELCNMYAGGRRQEFRGVLVGIHGEETVQELEETRDRDFAWDRDELQALIEDCRQRLKEMGV